MLFNNSITSFENVCGYRKSPVHIFLNNSLALSSSNGRTIYFIYYKLCLCFIRKFALNKYLLNIQPIKHKG